MPFTPHDRAHLAPCEYILESRIQLIFAYSKAIPILIQLKRTGVQSGKDHSQYEPFGAVYNICTWEMCSTPNCKQQTPQECISYLHWIDVCYTIFPNDLGVGESCCVAL